MRQARVQGLLPIDFGRLSMTLLLANGVLAACSGVFRLLADDRRHAANQRVKTCVRPWANSWLVTRFATAAAILAPPCADGSIGLA